MADVSKLGLAVDYLVTKANVDELEIVDATGREFGLLASVKNERLGFKIVTQNPVTKQRGIVRGTALFDAMVQWFSVRFEAIISEWVEGTNLEKLNELTTQGMPILDAAPFTWTSRQCIRHGYVRMALEEAVGGLAGRWGRVAIRWEREDKQ